MHPTDILLILAAVGGHLALVTFVFNRTYAHIIAHWITMPTRLTFLSLTFLPPLAFGYWLVAGRPGPADAVRWADLPWLLLGYLALCWAALAYLALVTVWRLVRPVPRAQWANHTRVVDVAERLGRPPIGTASVSWLARLPANQVFRVQIVEKHLALERLPAAWQGLRIVQLTDLHVGPYVAPEFFHECIRAARDLEPDLLVLTGDVADFVAWIPRCLSPLAGLEARYGKFAVTGNHDLWCGPERVRQHLREMGFTVLDDDWQTVDIRGHVLLVVGRASPWHAGPSSAPPADRVDSAAFRLGLTHTPDNVRWASRLGLDLVLCGHNHGGQVRVPLLGSIYCPSAYGRRYDCGLFQVGPMLLYVSRGLSGNIPLRYFCPPEITCFVLQARPGRGARNG